MLALHLLLLPLTDCHDSLSHIFVIGEQLSHSIIILNIDKNVILSYTVRKAPSIESEVCLLNAVSIWFAYSPTLFILELVVAAFSAVQPMNE